MTAVMTVPSDLPYQVGDTASRSVTLDAETVRTYATLVGDANPLHHDDDVARNSRFGGLIASGAHYGALMMGVVATFLTERGSSVGLSFDFQFRRAVRAGQTIHMDWRIVGIEPSEKLGGHLIRLEGEMTGDDGELFLRSTSTCLLLPESP